MQAFSYFPIQRFRFTIRARQHIALPFFPGYPLHGILGDMLIPSKCRPEIKGNDPPCVTCPRPSACAFAYLYKPDARHIPGAGTMTEYPRPYIINPTPVPAGGIKKHELYEFDITLIGRAANFITEIIAALLEAGDFGITGRSAEFDLANVEIIQADSNHSMFLDGRMNGLPYHPVNAAGGEHASQCDEVAISLLTPWRIKEQGNLVEIHLPFSLVLKSLVTRICNLALAYFYEPEFLSELAKSSSKDVCPFGKKITGCPYSPECEILKKKAQDIIIADQQIEPYLKSVDLEKWKKEGGLVGGVTYQGDMRPFMPVLQLGMHVHVGKLAMQGYGKYHLEC